MSSPTLVRPPRGSPGPTQPALLPCAICNKPCGEPISHLGAHHSLAERSPGALARWENEGGSLDTDWERRAALIQEEEHILHCLGAAVIMRWNHLPTEVQRELFASAASLSEPLHTAELKGQIARFLHSHKNV